MPLEDSSPWGISLGKTSLNSCNKGSTLGETKIVNSLELLVEFYCLCNIVDKVVHQQVPLSSLHSPMQNN